VNKIHLKALEQIYKAEIEQRLPLQSRSRVYDDLRDAGLVEHGQNTIGGRFPVVVSGWYLTQAGRLAYCLGCSPVSETDAP
jgi:hypothetical protein